MARFSAELVREALLSQVEALFRDLLGEPRRAAGSNWRTRGKPETSMAMRGERRGCWTTYATGQSGDVFDLVAVHLCNLARAGDDFPRVLEAAAAWAGISSEPMDQAELDRRRAEIARKAAEADAADEQRRLKAVRKYRAQAVPVAGTPAETYLRSRGITSWPDEAVAFDRVDCALVVWAQDAEGHIVGGQRIFLTALGTRALDANGEKRAKLSFGHIKGYPARFRARASEGKMDGRVYIAEGPESALTVWLATGAETWAVFGCTGFKTAPVPSDRAVVLCPDRDPTDGPAAQGFAAAADFLSTIADIHVVYAPEPEGSKRDLNDTLQRAGLDAVIAALTDTIAAWQPRERDRADLAPAVDFATLETRPVVNHRPRLDPGEARKRLREEVQAALRRGRGATLIQATLGLGKTAVTIQETVRLLDAARDWADAPAAVFAVPMHRLGRQVASDISEAAPHLRVVQVFGAEAIDPERPNETVCKRLKEYNDRRALLLDTEPFCDRCPFVATCLHISSRAEWADIYVVSHERLKSSGLPIKPGQTLVATIVDENPLSALANISRPPLTLAALQASPAAIPEVHSPRARTGIEADIRGFRLQLMETAEQNGTGYLRLESLAGWSEDHAKEAAALEWRRKITDEHDPAVRGNKTITRAAGIYREIARMLRDGLVESGRVYVQNGDHGLEIRLDTLSEIGGAYREQPMLLLDATADAEVYARMLGEPVAYEVTLTARENLSIQQDPTWSGAKSKFFNNGQPTDNLRRLRHYIEAHARTERVAVFSNKSILAGLDLPSDVATGHFNALRGLNDYTNCDLAIIIGRPLPDAGTLARMVGAIWGTPCTGEMQNDGRAWRQIEHAGETLEAETRALTHDDQRAECLLRVIRDAEVMQAIGRLRAVDRPSRVECILLSDAVIDYPVRLVGMKTMLWACDTVGEMLERGAAFLSPAHAAAAHADLYASKQAAASAFKSSIDRARLFIMSLYEKSCPVVTLRRPRSSATGTAFVRPSVTDPAAEIGRFIPDAEVLKVMAPPASALRRSLEIAPPPSPVTPSSGMQPEGPMAPRGLGTIIDLRLARAAAADARFEKALQQTDRARRARLAQPDNPGAAKAIGTDLSPVVARTPAPAPARRKLVYALRLAWEDALGQPLPLSAWRRRYVIDGATVRLAEDRSHHLELHSEMVRQWGILEAWLSEEPSEADYWR